MTPSKTFEKKFHVERRLELSSVLSSWHGMLGRLYIEVMRTLIAASSVVREGHPPEAGVSENNEISRTEIFGTDNQKLTNSSWSKTLYCISINSPLLSSATNFGLGGFDFS